MKTKITILGVITMVALFAGACSAALGTPKQTTIGVNYDEFAQQKNISKEVTIPLGSELIVELPSNPSTGFSWTEADIADTTVIKLDESKYVAPEGQVVGAAGKQVWTFTASEKGTSTVEMQYSRSWEGGEKAEWTFALTVTVQ